jgi:hypothetical protein
MLTVFPSIATTGEAPKDHASIMRDSVPLGIVAVWLIDSEEPSPPKRKAL